MRLGAVTTGPVGETRQRRAASGFFRVCRFPLRSFDAEVEATNR
jgi:hypothetical protein